MNKPLFNEAGLQQALQRLYQLDDQLLLTEVAALEECFNGWIQQQFALSQPQHAFFENMNAHALKFLTQQCSFAVGHRLPITLVKNNQATAPATGNDTDGDKLFEPKSKLQASTDAKGHFRPAGSLQIEVSYA